MVNCELIWKNHEPKSIAFALLRAEDSAAQDPKLVIKNEANDHLQPQIKRFYMGPDDRDCTGFTKKKKNFFLCRHHTNTTLLRIDLSLCWWRLRTHLASMNLPHASLAAMVTPKLFLWLSVVLLFLAKAAHGLTASKLGKLWWEKEISGEDFS